MLQFPVKLHNQHRFQYDQQYYIVDLEVGEILPVDEVVHAILEHCESCTFHELVEQLKPLYPKQTLFEGIRKLERLAKIGLIISQNAYEPIFREKETSENQIRVFALHSLDTPDPHSEDSWNLLRAMIDYVEISYAVFNEQQFPSILRETGIHEFVIQTESDHSLARCLESVSSSHDALLLLHADSLRTLQLFESVQMPVIARVSDDIQGTTHLGGIHGTPKIETVINSTLAMYAAMRPFDAAVIESPWLHQIFSHLLKHTEGFHFISLPKQVEAKRFPGHSTFADLSNLFQVDLTLTPPSGGHDNADWDSVAKAFVDLISELIRKRFTCESNDDGLVCFSQKYNPSSGAVSPQTFMFPSLFKRDINEAIIGTLSKTHNKKEIEIVRTIFAT